MPKQYWAVWYWHIRGDNGVGGWLHHGSYDTRADALDEQDYLRRGGDKTKIVKQTW